MREQPMSRLLLSTNKQWGINKGQWLLQNSAEELV
jgi:hypothetical protein